MKILTLIIMTLEEDIKQFNKKNKKELERRKIEKRTKEERDEFHLKSSKINKNKFRKTMMYVVGGLMIAGSIKGLISYNSKTINTNNLQNQNSVDTIINKSDEKTITYKQADINYTSTQNSKQIKINKNGRFNINYINGEITVTEQKKKTKIEKDTLKKEIYNKERKKLKPMNYQYRKQLPKYRLK